MKACASGLIQVQSVSLGARVMNKGYYVRDFMSSPPVTIPATARLLDAAMTLRSSAIRHLLIIDGNRVIGIISDRDIQRCAPSRLVPITEEKYNAIFENTPLASVMTREPQSISPDALLADAAAILQEGKVGCLPVVENGNLVGIITRYDLMAALLHVLNGENGSVSSDARS